MNDFIELVAIVAIILMLLALGISSWKLIIRSKKATVRILGVEMMATLLIGVIILLALKENTDTLLDVGIVLGALGFSGTVSVARYISEGRLF